MYWMLDNGAPERIGFSALPPTDRSTTRQETQRTVELSIGQAGIGQPITRVQGIATVISFSCPHGGLAVEWVVPAGWQPTMWRRQQVLDDLAERIEDLAVCNCHLTQGRLPLRGTDQ